MSVNGITKVVSHKWSKLSKDERYPFEQQAGEDKRRYDREVEE